MNCDRCQGLTVDDVIVTASGHVTMVRCVNCGHVVMRENFDATDVQCRHDRRE
jgi:uncharacterized Zn finger protein